MPRKGRLVQPRHIFPWIAAPYIEMLRILWRIERFFLSPIRYLRAWTVSAILGVMGVLFSVALFIPRLTETQVQASPSVNRRPLISPQDMPVIREEDLVLPESDTLSYHDISVRMQRTQLEDFDQFELVRTHSPVLTPKRSSLTYRPDAWTRHRLIQEEPDEHPLQSYVRQARVRTSQLDPVIPEYSYDPGVGDYRTQMERSPTLLIQKSVPQILSPDEPLTYMITVTNNGDEPVEFTTVEESVSDLNRVISCEPRAMVSANFDRLVWDLLELQPQETRHLSVTIQPDKRRPITQDTTVSFSSAPVIGETMVRQPEQESKPEIIPEAVTRPASPGRPKLIIEFDPPQTVQVGEELEAYYTITNVGTADATGIRLLVEVPPQLRHRFGELVEHKISRLAPEESRRALFAALAEGSGRLPLNWTLEANELDSQSSSEWLAVLAEPTPAQSSPVKSSIPANSSIPASEPNPISSIPVTEPTPISSIPENQPTPIEETSPLASPRPLGDRTSIPAWTAPALGDEPDPLEDLGSQEPIDPVLAPDESQPRSSIPGIAPPLDLFPLEEKPSSIPSTVPRDELPVEELGGVKAQ